MAIIPNDTIQLTFISWLEVNENNSLSEIVEYLQSKGMDAETISNGIKAYIDTKEISGIIDSVINEGV